MTRDSVPAGSSDGGLPPTERRSVLAGGALASVLALMFPLYHVLADLQPAVAAVLPPVVARIGTGLGVCVVLPATFAYAHWLEATDRERSSRSGPEYGVGDRWERQNL